MSTAPAGDVSSYAALASQYTRTQYANELSWTRGRLKASIETMGKDAVKSYQWVLATVAADAVTAQQKLNETLGCLKSKWNQWGVSRVLFLDQAIDQGLLQLPSALASLIWRTLYAAIVGLGFYRTGAPDYPRERFIASWNNFKGVVGNLGYGVAGAVWPVLAVWLENKISGPKAATPAA